MEKFYLIENHGIIDESNDLLTIDDYYYKNEFVVFTRQELEFIKDHMWWDAGMNQAKANAYQNLELSIKCKIERILK